MISEDPVYMRAARMAVSFASVPLLVKNDLLTLPGVKPATFLASAACGSVANTVETCCSLSTCSWTLAFHLIVAMAHADGENAAEEVQILVAVRVPDELIFGMIQNQRLLEVMEDGREQKILIGENDFFFGHGVGG